MEELGLQETLNALITDETAQLDTSSSASTRFLTGCPEVWSNEEGCLIALNQLLSRENGKQTKQSADRSIRYKQRKQNIQLGADAVSALGPGKAGKFICTGQFAAAFVGKDVIVGCICQIRNSKAIFELPVPIPTSKNQLVASITIAKRVGDTGHFMPVQNVKHHTDIAQVVSLSDIICRVGCLWNGEIGCFVLPEENMLEIQSEILRRAN